MRNQQFNFVVDKNVIAATFFILILWTFETVPAQVVHCPSCQDGCAAFDEVRASVADPPVDPEDYIHIPGIPAEITHEFTDLGATLKLELTINAPEPVCDNGGSADPDTISWNLTLTHLSGSQIAASLDLYDTTFSNFGRVSDDEFSEGETLTVQGGATVAIDFNNFVDTGNLKEYGVGGAVDIGEPSLPVPAHRMEMVGYWCCREDDAGLPGPCITGEPIITQPLSGCRSDDCESAAGKSAFSPLPALLSHGKHTDYSARPNTGAECSDCTNSRGNAPGSILPYLTFSRRLIPANQVTIGNSSPGMFFDFDYRLTIIKDDSSAGDHGLLFDPCSGLTFCFHDDDDDGTYDPDLTTYFDAFVLMDVQGNPVTDPADFSSGPLTATLRRHNGWKYRFELCSTPLSTDEYGAKLLEMVSPQIDPSADPVDGFKTAFTYKQFDPEQIDSSPALQLQIDTITDAYGNAAQIDYDTVQQAGRWVINKVEITTADSAGLFTLDYAYNTNGHMEKVYSYISNTAKGEDDVISTYTYDTDPIWECPAITWNQRLWDNEEANDTILLAANYLMWQGEMVNQFANILLGRADGTGFKYMSVSQKEGVSGLSRVLFRGRLIEWQKGAYWRYYEDYDYDPNVGGFDGYTGTMEPYYAHHPSMTVEQLLNAQPLICVSQTGQTVNQFYDANGNPTRTFHLADSSFELRGYDSENRETYYRDRGGFVTVTQWENGNIKRIIRGVQDQEGDGNWVASADSIQELFGYDAEGLLQWSAVTPYTADYYVPPENERTDFVHNDNRYLVEVKKPLPAGQTQRPSIVYTWAAGLLESMTNENNAGAETYEYDDFGRLVETNYPGGSTDETWRDEDHDLVYRKDRNNVVSRTKRDAAGRIVDTINAYGHDETLFDGAAIRLNTPHVQALTTYLYGAGKIQPSWIKRDGNETQYERDYRNRVVQTTRFPNSTSILIETTEYRNNLVFSTTQTIGGYVKRQYVGHSADQLAIRRIETRGPTIIFNSNEQILDAVRIDRTQVDPDHVITDAIRDPRGNVIELIDAYGQIIRNQFDALGRKTKTTRGFDTPLAMETTTKYDHNGNVTRTTQYSNDPARDLVTDMVYDNAGNLQARTIPDVNMTWSYTYHPDGRQKMETLPSTGVNTHYFEDCCGRVSGLEDAEGGGVITLMDAGGRTVHRAVVRDYEFGADSYLNPVDAKTLGETSSRYQDDGRIKYQTVWKSARGLVTPQEPEIAGVDGVPATDGVTTQYVYFQGLVSGINPWNTHTQQVRLLGGNSAVVSLVSALDQLALPPVSGGASVSFTSRRSGGAKVTISPDEKSMNVAITDAAGRNVMNAIMSGPNATTPNQMLSWSCTQYDQTEGLENYPDNGGAAFGAVEVKKQIVMDKTMADESNNIDAEVTVSYTDGFGWNVGSRDQDDNLSRVKFDVAGNPLEVFDRLQQPISYTYDDLGRQTSMTDLVGTTHTIYEPTTGRVKASVDAKQNSTGYLYDVLGRVTQTTDRLGKTTHRDYDPQTGQLELLTDAEGFATHYQYDLLGRRTQIILNPINADPPQTTVYEYDAAGRQSTITLNSGAQRTMVFELSGALDRIEYLDPTGGLVGTDDFSYDPQLRRTGGTSVDGVIRELTYTDQGQVDTDTTVYSGQSYVVDYDYDPRGRIQKVTYPSHRAVEYAYTNHGELDIVKWNETQVEDRTYDVLQRLTNVDRAAVGEIRTYEMGRLKSISNTNLGQASYAYDVNHNKLGETWTGPLAPWSFTTQTGASPYPDGYDQEDRFRRFYRLGQNQDVYLDRSDIGNIFDYQTNGSSQLRDFNEVHQLNSIGADTQTFDANGNLSQSHTTMTLTWQQGSDRLTQCAVPEGAPVGIEGTNDYGYDADGKRVWKKITRDGSVAQHTVYIYAGPNCIAEYPANAAPESPDQEYVYGNTIDSLLMIARENNSQQLTVARNQQWSVAGLLNASDGSIAELYSYDTLGNRTILDPDGTTVRSSSNYNNPYGYTSRRHDAETGLMYYRARYYDPITGQFISPDPLQYVDGMSLYRGYFVPGNVDPLGTEYMCLAIVTGGNSIPYETKQASVGSMNFVYGGGIAVNSGANWVTVQAEAYSYADWRNWASMFRSGSLYESSKARATCQKDGLGGCKLNSRSGGKHVETRSFGNLGSKVSLSVAVFVLEKPGTLTKTSVTYDAQFGAGYGGKYSINGKTELPMGGTKTTLDWKVSIEGAGNTEKGKEISVACKCLNLPNASEEQTKPKDKAK